MERAFGMSLAACLHHLRKLVGRLSRSGRRGAISVSNERTDLQRTGRDMVVRPPACSRRKYGARIPIAMRGGSHIPLSRRAGSIELELKNLGPGMPPFAWFTLSWAPGQRG